MDPDRSRRGLQLALRVLGLVALLAGSATVVFGVASIAGAEEVSGTVDSEMRFFAVWYAAAGLLLLRSARDVAGETTIIRGIAIAFFVAGCSRALSWAVVGEPHLAARVLMVVELVLPAIIVPWQASIARQEPLVVRLAAERGEGADDDRNVDRRQGHSG